MTDRPILMNASMVRAILAGTKTQTRRVMKPQPPEDHARLIVETIHPTYIDRYGEEQPGAERFGVTTADGEWCLPCPYGHPGDRLWVRETWGVLFPQYIADVEHEPTFYRADHANDEAAGVVLPKWRPSIHMPRARSRITIDITALRVERLQDISESDAKAEGAEPYLLPVNPSREALRHVDGFCGLWESINGKGSWAQNPFVFVVTFNRVC